MSTAQLRDWARLVQAHGPRNAARIAAATWISYDRDLWPEVVRAEDDLSPNARARRLGQRRGRDGALIGWRRWLLRDDRLRSPYQGTDWHGPVLTASEWSDSAALRGERGIHALIRHARTYDPRTETGPIGAPQHVGQVHGRVRGYGRYVLGTSGWRAERAVIDLLVVHQATPAAIVDALATRYQCRVIGARRSICV